MNKKMTALITGASSGIGKAIAHEFAKNNYDVVLVSGNEDELGEVAFDMKNKYPNILISILIKNLVNENSPQEIYDDLKKSGTKIDVLVNNAEADEYGVFWEISIEKHMRIIRLNIEAFTRLMQLYLPLMVKKNSGKILNISSITEPKTGPFRAVYFASKAYVNSLSESLQEELKWTDVTFTCACLNVDRLDLYGNKNRKPKSVLKKKDILEIGKYCSNYI